MSKKNLAVNKLPDFLKDSSLEGSTVIIRHGNDQRSYQLGNWKKEGMLGIAWKASYRGKHDYCIKFINDDDPNWNPEAEFIRTAKLPTKIFAKFEFYGVPDFNSKFTSSDYKLIAQVVEWVDGQTLEEELQAGTLSVTDFREISKQLCYSLAALAEHNLSHDDLHSGNVMLEKSRNSLTGELTRSIKIIDTGWIKQQETRYKLLEDLRSEISTLEPHIKDKSVKDKYEKLKHRYDWFKINDQERIVELFIEMYNRVYRDAYREKSSVQKFLENLPDSFKMMLDPIPERRIGSAKSMFDQFEQAWLEAHPIEMSAMNHPFEFIAAELIHSDERFVELFSEECPWLQFCRRPDPVYLHGPRGCGKSTLFRMLSVKTILSITDQEKMKKAYDETPFFGVFISCSSELRSRFWLLQDDFLSIQEANIVRFFSLLLLESLVETLNVVEKFESNKGVIRFGLSDDVCQRSVKEILYYVGDTDNYPRLEGVSVFEHCRHRIRVMRDQIWKNIIERQAPKCVTNAALVGDICRRLSEIIPIFNQRPIVFLLDDYSRQRIGEKLQKRLNQAITFAKHGTPQFMVSSEYLGVNLDDVQEGREVVPVNAGAVYISLKEESRWNFLEDMLSRRLDICKYKATIRQLVGMSKVSPGISMAQAIRKSYKEKKPFYYHGLDTISDVCSGDLAMALELVRNVFQQAKVTPSTTAVIAPRIQDEAIRGFSERQLELIRFSVPHGSVMAEIADRLAYLAHCSALYQDEKKNGMYVPVVKTHLDITIKAMRELPEMLKPLLYALEYRAIIFPLTGSRSRQEHEGTERFQIKRILLPRLLAPLGRRTPIKIDTAHKLRHLLENPKEFVDSECKKQESLKYN